MVSSEQDDVLRMFNFDQKQQSDDLYRMVTSVNIVTKEHILCPRNFTTCFEQLKEIMELTMSITSNCHRRGYINNIVFSSKHFSNFLTDPLYITDFKQFTP